MANRSLEWTSDSWPHYAACMFSAPRGKHHGYFLPSEGANKGALAMFTFPSMALYEEYRTKSLQDPECQATLKYVEDTRCIISSDRSFFRTVF